MEEDKKANGSFEELSLKDNLLRGIYSYGFEVPSAIQSSAIPVMKSGKDVIAQAQSGTGKTGAFVIGSLEKVDPEIEGTQIIIISPTRELSKQTTEVVIELSKYMKISYLEVVGGTDIFQCRSDLDKLPQVVIGTPGRILDMINKKSLFTDKLTTLIFDEADEILSYGFKETIYNIVKCIPEKCQICLFSATIPSEVIELTNSFMNNPESILVKKEALTLEGITQFYINIKVSDWKYDILKDLYDTISISQCIIYFNSKNKLNQVYKDLIGENFPVSMIHGELTSDERKRTMNEFKGGQTRILLSTDLLSRGIDIQQLSLVINFDIPRSKETYIHRIGRSGRYGRKGVAINFVTERDMENLENIRTFYNTKIEEMPQNIVDYLSV
jgi:translation initiation factor 4A